MNLAMYMLVKRKSLWKSKGLRTEWVKSWKTPAGIQSGAKILIFRLDVMLLVVHFYPKIEGHSFMSPLAVRNWSLETTVIITHLWQFTGILSERLSKPELQIWAMSSITAKSLASVFKSLLYDTTKRQEIKSGSIASIGYIKHVKASKLPSYID